MGEPRTEPSLACSARFFARKGEKRGQTNSFSILIYFNSLTIQFDFSSGISHFCTGKVDFCDFSSLTASLPVGKVALLVTWSGHQVDALIAHE